MVATCWKLDVAYYATYCRSVAEIGPSDWTIVKRATADNVARMIRLIESRGIVVDLSKLHKAKLGDHYLRVDLTRFALCGLCSNRWRNDTPNCPRCGQKV